MRVLARLEFGFQGEGRGAGTAVLAGLNHHGLRKALIEMKKADVELAELWKDYLEELDVIWSRNHLPNGAKCAGIECVNDRSKDSFESSRV